MAIEDDQQRAEEWADRMLDSGTYPPDTSREDLIQAALEQFAYFKAAREREAAKTPYERYMGGPEGPAGAMGYQGPRPPDYGTSRIPQ